MQNVEIQTFCIEYMCVICVGLQKEADKEEARELTPDEMGRKIASQWTTDPDAAGSGDSSEERTIQEGEEEEAEDSTEVAHDVRHVMATCERHSAPLSVAEWMKQCRTVPKCMATHVSKCLCASGLWCGAMARRLLLWWLPLLLDWYVQADVPDYDRHIIKQF